MTGNASPGCSVGLVGPQHAVDPHRPLPVRVPAKVEANQAARGFERNAGGHGRAAHQELESQKRAEEGSDDANGLPVETHLHVELVLRAAEDDDIEPDVDADHIEERALERITERVPRRDRIAALVRRRRGLHDETVRQRRQHPGRRAEVRWIAVEELVVERRSPDLHALASCRLYRY